MSSELSIERLEKEVNRTSLLTIAATILILVGLGLTITSTVSWVILADKASDLYSHDLATRDSAPSGDQIAKHRVVLGSHDKWLDVLPYLGITLILLGTGGILWVFVKRVRLRMTVSAVALPTFRTRGS